MTALSIVVLVIALVVVWGGLIASALALRAQPERTNYPAGGFDDERDADPIIEHDT